MRTAPTGRAGPRRGRAPRPGSGVWALLALGLTAVSAPSRAEDPPPPPRVERLELLGEVRLAPGTRVLGTTLGGLSALAYDPGRGCWYALSDDRSQVDPARFYTLTLNLSDGRLDRADLAFTAVTPLTDAEGRTFPAKSLDPEGLALARDGASLFVSSEGDPRIGQAPWVKGFGLDGRERRTFAVPERYLPAPGRGVRVNLGFEALTRTPDGRTLVTAVENALLQDGPPADLSHGSRCRVLFLDVASGKAVREAAYDLEPVAKAPTPPTALKTNGLPDLLALDDVGTFLLIERSFSEGAGATVRLYEVDLREASDTSALPALSRPDGSYEPVERRGAKRLLLDLATLGIRPDNLEAMALGPSLPDGRRLLVLLSDDNFSPVQVTQVLAFAVTFAAPAGPPPAR